MVTCVLVRFGDDPGGCVAHAEIENFALLDNCVEGLHEFGDGSCEVPPVDVEDVEVIGLQFAERGIERHV